MRTMFYGRRKFFIAPLILVAVIAFGAVTMLLWNALMPVIFHLPEITFWQAVGLLILARLFFGTGKPRSSHDSHYRSKIRDKVLKMTPEERREFFKNVRRDHHVWHHEFCGEKESAGQDHSGE